MSQPITEAPELSAFGRPSSLHELSPYLGKMRPELAAWAVEVSTEPGDYIYDPFCGSGTVLLEARIRGRWATGTDLNPYATLLSRAKSQVSPDIRSISGLEYVETYSSLVKERLEGKPDDRLTGETRAMFHPKTLRSLAAWVDVLQEARDDFGLACLMGIAHHQRPGFLSYPASHTVPYLRTNSFPPHLHPELYEFRDVESRLARKIDRALRRFPDFDWSQPGRVIEGGAGAVEGESVYDAIITSPPYMGQLHYGRDNRVRLDLLGCKDWHALDEMVSPRLTSFLNKSVGWLSDWSRLLKPGGTLSVLVGDKTNTTRRPFAKLVSELVLESGSSYTELRTLVSPIPSRRRVRKGCDGSSAELLLQYRIEK